MLKQFVYGTGENVTSVSADGEKTAFIREKDAVSFPEEIRIEKSLELKAD